MNELLGSSQPIRPDENIVGLEVWWEADKGERLYAGKGRLTGNVYPHHSAFWEVVREGYKGKDHLFLRWMFLYRVYPRSALLQLAEQAE